MNNNNIIKNNLNNNKQTGPCSPDIQMIVF